MGQKKQRSPAQTEQTKSLSRLRKTRSHSDGHSRNELADTRAELRKVTRLAKEAQIKAKKEVRNTRKRELRALRRVDLETAEAENLQAQIKELTARRDNAAREVEAIEEQHSETKKELRRVLEQLSRVSSESPPGYPEPPE